MLAIIRTAETRSFVIDDEGNQALIPWLKLPSGTRWRGRLTDQGVPRLTFERAGRSFTAMFLDFGMIGGVPTFVAEIREYADVDVVAFLKSRLGASNVTRFLKALRNSAEVRQRAKDLGYKRVRNGAGKIINVRAPLVTAGRPSVDWNNEDPETAPEIPGLE